MTYPNAAKGIEKLHIAEILIIIGTIIDDLSVYLLSEDGLNLDIESIGNVWLIVIMLVVSSGSLLIIIGDILNLIGLRLASKDDKLFKIPLYLTFALIIALIIIQIVPRVIFIETHGEAINEFMEYVEEIIELVQIVCVIVVCRKMARGLNGTNMVTLSNRMLALEGIVILVSIVASIIILIVSEATLICAIVVEVIEIIAQVTYLLYVDKAIEFLKEN